MQPQIMGISFRVPETTFVSSLEEAIQECDSNNGLKMSYSSKTSIMRRSGKTVYLCTLENDGATASITIAAEKDDINKELVFTPMKIKNINESFYECKYSDDSIIGTDNDPGQLMMETLLKTATERGGTFAYLPGNDNRPIIVKEGNRKNFGYLCCTDSDGHVYSLSGAKSSDLDDDDDDDDAPSLRIKTPINVWLQQNPTVAAAINGINTIDGKMNYIGKYLVSERLADNIDHSEFMDIFRQAGVFGFSDPTVLNFYKLLI